MISVVSISPESAVASPWSSTSRSANSASGLSASLTTYRICSRTYTALANGQRLSPMIAFSSQCLVAVMTSSAVEVILFFTRFLFPVLSEKRPWWRMASKEDGELGAAEFGFSGPSRDREFHTMPSRFPIVIVLLLALTPLPARAQAPTREEACADSKLPYVLNLGLPRLPDTPELQGDKLQTRVGNLFAAFYAQHGRCPNRKLRINITVA